MRFRFTPGLTFADSGAHCDSNRRDGNREPRGGCGISRKDGRRRDGDSELCGGERGSKADGGRQAGDEAKREY